MTKIFAYLKFFRTFGPSFALDAHQAPSKRMARDMN